MKKVYLYFLFTLVTSSLSAAEPVVICGNIFSDDSLIIKIFEPINGYYNQASVNINAAAIRRTKDSFYYSVGSLNIPAFFFSINVIEPGTDLFIGRLNFLVCSGDSIHISIKPQVRGFNWIVFSGDNAEGNNLFEKMNYSPAEKFTSLFRLLRDLPANRTTCLCLPSLIFRFLADSLHCV